MQTDIANSILPKPSDVPTSFPPAPAIVPADGGESLEFFGEKVSVKIDGARTGGAYSIMEFLTPAGGGSPPHSHDREDEIFMIRSGGLRVLANGNWHEAGPGDVVFAPKQRVHAYRNHGAEPCRFWLMVSPAGFEDFYRELSQDSADRTAPDMDRLRVICERHGIHLAE